MHRKGQPLKPIGMLKVSRPRDETSILCVFCSRCIIRVIKIEAISNLVWAISIKIKCHKHLLMHYSYQDDLEVMGTAS